MTVYLCQIVMGANGFDLCVDGRERFKQRERSEEHLPRVMSANSQQSVWRGPYTCSDGRARVYFRLME